MISNRVKKRFNRVVAGLVSAAMTLTMVPDVWLPVHAEIVRDQIENAEIPDTSTINRNDTTDPMNGYEYTLYEFDGHKYAYVATALLWNEAKEVCEKWGGHLAYIESVEEDRFISSINKSDYVALGGWDEPAEGIWTWTDGSEFTYTNWSYGEPNNSASAQDHLFMYANGKWDDGYYYIKAPFICEWEENVQNSIGKISEYTVFSSNQNEDLTLNGWKSNFTGGIYSGRNFVCNLSEFYLDGKVDAAGTITANGWKINIPEKNENIEAIAMPDLEEAILAKAGEYTYYAESPSYIQDTNIINGSIMVSGDVTISGTNFEGDCYIIADRDITYNVNNLNTTGRLVLYSRNGNITVNGTNINIDGIMYAPKGKVSFNANETTVNGRIWADTVNFSGSIFNIKGSDSDLDLIGNGQDIDIPTEYSILSQGKSEYGYKQEFVEKEWSIGKDTTFGSTMIELVPNECYKNGFCYYKINKHLDSDFSFSARFTFSLDYTTSLADGLAFVIQTNDSKAGAFGEGIGYGNISPSLAIEFDNYRNAEPNGNHIGVMLNGVTNKHYAICDYEQLRTNGGVHDAWIEYDGNNKMLYVSAAQYDTEGQVRKPEKPMIAYPLDLNELFSGQEYVYFGLTAATGTCRASHKLHGVEFDPNPESLYYGNDISNEPTIEIIPSKKEVALNKEAYFKVSTTLDDKIKAVEYLLNGDKVSISDGKYVLDTSEAGTYTLTAKAVTNSGRTVTASASIEVIKSSKPVVDLTFDKESYAEGDDVIVTVIASDENGIAGVALEYDGKQVELDENNSYKIEKITAGEHTLVGVAWNAAGIVSSAGYTITIEPKTEQIITIEAITEKSEIYLGETARLTVNVNGGDGTEKIYVDVNGKQLSSDTNVYEYTPDSVGEYIFNVTVETASGASKTLSLSVNVVNKADIPEQDTSAPTVEVSLDKDIYYEGDDIIITVNAEDNVGVANIVVTVNEKEISPEESGKYIIKNAALGTYEIKATAYDAAGNSSWVSVSVPVNEKGSEPADKLTLEVNIDTSKVKVGEPFDINITANGGVGEKTISCTVNNESVAVENSKASYAPEQFGTYDIAVSAVDEAGSNITKRIKVTISESGADIEDDDENEYDEDCDYVNKYQPSPVVRVIPEQTAETEVKLTAEMIDMIEQLASPTAVY